MNLRSVLLGFLARRDMTGYELKGAMEKSVGHFFGASYGSIYPALRDLEGEGLVRSTRVVQSERPNKKVYTLTPEGLARFREALEEAPAGDSFRSEFLIQLYFGNHQDPERLLALIGDYRAYLEGSLERLRETGDRIRYIPQARYGRMCLRFGLVYHECISKWLDEVEGEVRAIAHSEGSRKAMVGSEEGG